MTETTPAAGAGGRNQRVDDAVDALRRTVLAVRDAWEVVLLFVLVAPLSALLGSAVGVYLVGARRPGSVERGRASNSLGVRIFLALLAAFVAGVVIIVGLLLLVLPGLYLGVRLYLVIPAVMLGDDGPLEALGSSWDRTGGHVFTVAGVAAAILAVSLAVFTVVLVGTAGGVDPAIERVLNDEATIPQAARTLVSGPLGAAAMAVLYNGLE